MRELHAAHRAFAGRRHHVGAVGGGAVADDLGVDLGAARAGALELLEHQDAAAAGDHEAVAVLVVGAARPLGRVVVLGRHGAHGVEQHRQRPVELLAAAGEHAVGLAELDAFDGVADAVRRGRAGRADRVVEALDLVGGREVGRDRARHGARHHERADALGALLLGDDGRLHDGAGGRPAGAGDQAGALVGDLGLAEARVGDRLLHGEIGVGRAVAHEAAQAAVDQLVDVDLQRAGDLAAEAELRVLRHELDAGLAVLQRLRDLGGVVADRGDDAQAGDDDTLHDVSRCRRGCDRVLEQADLQAGGFVDQLAVGMHEAVGDAEHQLAQRSRA